MKKSFVFLLSAAMLLTACSQASESSVSSELTSTAAIETSSVQTIETTESSETSETTTLSTVVNTHGEELGSAAELSGRIVVVSIFASDYEGDWYTFERDWDHYRQEVAIEKLTTAVEWIEDQAASYGRYVEFIYDYEEDEDLVYYMDFDMDIFEGKYTYPYHIPLYEAIHDEIPTEDLLNWYEADEIIYMFYLNAEPMVDTEGETNDKTRSCARTYYDGAPYYYEFCLINMNAHPSCFCSPGDFAHEILHLFGAPDLYMEDNGAHPEIGISQDYVDYLGTIDCKDVMYHLWWYDDLYEIQYTIDDLTAYYLGLTDYSETVEEWGFGPSEHLT